MGRDERILASRDEVNLFGEVDVVDECTAINDNLHFS